MKRRLNFELLPPVEATTIFMKLDTDIEARLKSVGYLEEAINRANGSLMQFHSASAKKASWFNESHIRAGLADFRSMADCLTREYRAAGLRGKPAPIFESLNPLIHLMVLLRDVNLHATATRSSTQETTVISQLGGEPHEYTYDAVVLEPFDVGELLGRRTDYYCQEIEAVVSWLFEKQVVFGVAHIFHEGIEAYCREIIAACMPNQRMHATREDGATKSSTESVN